MNSFSDLSKTLKGETEIFPATLGLASHDASIFEVKPKVVIYPKNVDDIQTVVRYVLDHNDLNITARSAGTDMSGGPLGDSIILDFTKHFNKIGKIADGYAIAQPGVFYRDFDKATKAVGGQILPSYPASRELCTVGGMVANNSGGEKTLTYGKTEKYIRRLKMVLADGQEYEFSSLSLHELEQQKKFPNFESEIYRKMHELIVSNYDLIEKSKPSVTKNSCGYYLWNVLDKKANRFDLTRLIVGSQGTLGLITEIEFGLVKPKPYSRLLVIFLKDMSQLGNIASHVLQFNPESFESYDDHTFKVAVKFLPTLIRQMKGNIFSLAWRFIPEMLAVLRGGVPKMVLMAEFTGNTPLEALHKANQAQESLVKWEKEGPGRKVQSRVTESAGDADKYWVIRRESFNMLRKHVKNLRTAPFIDDFVIRPERLPEFLPKLYEILNQYKHLTYTIAGHVGDGNFHIIPLMDLHDPEAHRTIEDLSVKVYTLVHEFGGSITGEHNDGIIRTPFVKMQYGEEMYKLFEEVKKIWDPKGIFNPGKKVGGTLDYAFKHIVR